jgi:hypothetical protein
MRHTALPYHLDGSQPEAANDQTRQVAGKQQASRASRLQNIGCGQGGRLITKLTVGSRCRRHQF